MGVLANILIDDHVWLYHQSARHSLRKQCSFTHLLATRGFQIGSAGRLSTQTGYSCRSSSSSESRSSLTVTGPIMYIQDAWESQQADQVQ